VGDHGTKTLSFSYLNGDFVRRGCGYKKHVLLEQSDTQSVPCSMQIHAGGFKTPNTLSGYDSLVLKASFNFRSQLDQNVYIDYKKLSSSFM